MQHISYLKIQNFKIFGDEIVIHFDTTTVLVGPNNAGKTTIIQALAIWQLGIRAFVDSKTVVGIDKKLKFKGKLDDKTGIGINRRDIEQVPHTDTRQLFNKNKIRAGKDNISIKISVGITFNNVVEECSVFFKYFKSEIIYAYLSTNLCNEIELLKKSSDLQINLLYPMSGLEREETLLQEGAIRKQIGRGITAGLLRNVCYNLYINQPKIWEELVKMMEKLFYIKLNSPQRLANDDLILDYNYIDITQKSENHLDILQAGRGQLQILLILAFAMARKQSVIMIDEPDAHLEVLRQSQIMEVLKSVSDKFQCQIIVATHSEIVMNEANSLNLIHHGKKIELDENKKKSIKSSLGEFGIEQFYKATLTKFVLYLEGTTDKQNLVGLAKYLKHPLEEILNDRFFVYYTQSPDALNSEFEITPGYYQTHKKHFSALKPLVEDLRGMALFDSDNQNRENEDMGNGLKIRFWKEYELENYFITPESVEKYIEHYYKEDGNDGLFLENDMNNFRSIFESNFLFPIFDKNEVLLNIYRNSNPIEKKALYNNSSKSKKVSLLLEIVFQNLAQQSNSKIILRKNDFYKIIPFCNEVKEEVKVMLDEIFHSIVN